MNTLMAAIAGRGMNKALSANNPRASATTAIPQPKVGDCVERFLRFLPCRFFSYPPRERWVGDASAYKRREKAPILYFIPTLPKRAERSHQLRNGSDFETYLTRS